LPEINSDETAPESSLIETGKVIFRMNHFGLAPQIGWAETNFGSPAIPTYVASVIE